jgi:hypothetical protein
MLAKLRASFNSVRSKEQRPFISAILGTILKQFNNFETVRLRNYSKSITKTRKYENTKQDIEIKLAAFGGISLTG